MPAQQLKVIVKEAINEFNKNNLDGYLNIYDENVVLHGFPAGLPPGKSGARAFYTSFLSAFKYQYLIIEEMVAENNSLACRYSLKAVHKGEFMGKGPTNKEVVVQGMTILHFVGKKCVERWQSMDETDLLKQLGV